MTGAKLGLVRHTKRKIIRLVVGKICNISDQNNVKFSMKNSIAQQIRSKIAYSRFGDVFFASSFAKYDVEYVTKLLSIFEGEGLISRVSYGVYVKVRKTRFGVVYPSAYELVVKIAKRDKAKVIPTGATAANILGFSTQVPTNTVFLTTGSGRKLRLGHQTVTLKHGAPRNFCFRGQLMSELVQALKNIGERNVTPSVEERIGKLLSESPEPDTIEHDLLLAPVWMRQVIKKAIRR